MALGFLALAWCFADCDAPASLCAFVALGIVFAIDPHRYAHAARWLDLLSAVLLAWALYGLARTELAIIAAHGAPGDLAAEMRRSTALRFDYTPLAFIAAALAITGRPRLRTPAIGTIAAVGALFVGPDMGPTQRGQRQLRHRRRRTRPSFIQSRLIPARFCG